MPDHPRSQSDDGLCCSPAPLAGSRSRLRRRPIPGADGAARSSMSGARPGQLKGCVVRSTAAANQPRTHYRHWSVQRPLRSGWSAVVPGRSGTGGTADPPKTKPAQVGAAGVGTSWALPSSCSACGSSFETDPCARGRTERMFARWIAPRSCLSGAAWPCSPHSRLASAGSEEAMRLLAQLQETDQRLRDLQDGLTALLERASPETKGRDDGTWVIMPGLG